ncbi:hypothetical protein B7494_g3138 [Chlorociboria aeruginascens]|nr:hypothetical protein B7494_g3138 [Chlorociboria aeruginascens]
MQDPMLDPIKLLAPLLGVFCCVLGVIAIYRNLRNARTITMASSSEDDLIDNDAEAEDDLFGDDDKGDEDQARELSDRELDSGDDEDRRDKVRNTKKPEDDAGMDARILEATLYRHPIPKPVDGEYNTLRLPSFIGIEPHAFDPNTFEPPTTDHHTNTRSANFSANATSSSTIRYRRNAAGKLESNTNIYHWSDGSTTIAIGDQHYELETQPLAPPKDSKTYQEVQDSHSYLASPSIDSQMILLFGHLTNQHTVRPNKDIEDDALEKLQKSLAAAARGSHKGDDKNGPELITNTQDPELQKKQAEMAEKERMRLQRRRENAAEKAIGPGRRGPGGLTVDDIEGRAGRRAPGSGRKAPGSKRPRRRADDYDSDDDMPRGKFREDEYDKEDDFLASSDEDLEEVPDGDDDDDDILDDDIEKDEPRSKKQKTSRHVEISDADADADAEADLDDDDAPAAPIPSEPAARGRKRNIIEDDDDE